MVPSTKPPTQFEWSLVLWGLMIVMIIGGLVGLVASFFVDSPESSRQVGPELRSFSGLFLCLGIGGAVVLRRLQNFED